MERAKGGFRRPLIGGRLLLAGTQPADWPLEPIDIVDGVPFLISEGYILAGHAESAADYLDYCVRECDWSPVRYAHKMPSELEGSLEKFLKDMRWRHPLNVHESEFLTEQIEQGRAD